MAEIKNCEWCGSEFEDKHRDGKRFCTRSCARFHTNATFGNPQKGKTGDKNPNWKGGTVCACKLCGASFDKGYVQDYCSRLCAARVLAARRKRNTDTACATCGKLFYSKRISAKYCSLGCYKTSSSFVELQGMRNRGKPTPEHTKQAVSRASSARNSQSSYTSGKSGHHQSAKSGTVYFRSSYEERAYKILDNNLLVTSYQAEPFTIEYINADGNLRRYKPDILVEQLDKKIIIEVKPRWKMPDPTVQLKISAGMDYAKKNGMTFEVWTENELGIQTGPTPARL